MNHDERTVTVCGGINLDIHVQTLDAEVIRGTSNPAQVHLTPGGVARNIAENLAALGTAVTLLGAVGDDELSARLLEATNAVGVDTSRVRRMAGLGPGTYVAIMDGNGEMDVAAADMRVTDAVDAAYVESCRAPFEQSRLIVADTNLTSDALQRILDIAAAAWVPVIVDPVSVKKALKLQELSGHVFAVTPNESEARVLEAGTGGLRIAHTIVTRGPAGALWCDHAVGSETEVAAQPCIVQDVTGAGDAFVAGLVAGLLRYDAPESERGNHRPAQSAGRGGFSRDAMRRALGLAGHAAAVVVASSSSTLTAEAASRVREAASGP